VSSEIPSAPFFLEREHMVKSQLRARGIRDECVLAAMARVPRHRFVSDRYWDRAYQDHPIPIAAGQTVSQPYIVAVMLQALSLRPSSRVLEVGTGSGYQTAILAEICAEVYSVERHAQLASNAEALLLQLGYPNITIVIGDGSKGLPEAAPFDAIAVSAAAAEIPQPLFEQLREGGRMVLPVGGAEAQELQLVRKHEDQAIIERLEGCRFVPLIADRTEGP
jgi:protein-L-isoaspartate(D-aspartate) O-methyltransferase